MQLEIIIGNRISDGGMGRENFNRWDRFFFLFPRFSGCFDIRSILPSCLALLPSISPLVFIPRSGKRSIPLQQKEMLHPSPASPIHRYRHCVQLTKYRPSRYTVIPSSVRPPRRLFRGSAPCPRSGAQPGAGFPSMSRRFYCIGSPNQRFFRMCLLTYTQLHCFSASS